MRISDWSSDVCSSDLVGGTGSLNILTSVSLYADARAFGGGASGGALRAGRINIAAHDGGSFAIAEDLFATADAYGFAAYPGSSFLTPGTADALGDRTSTRLNSSH